MASPSCANPDRAPYLLRVSGLTKVFRLQLLNGKTVTACQGISFRLNAGEALGIRGPSGSGKSTVLRCIFRTYLPTSGEIAYRSACGEVDLARAGERAIIALRQWEIAYVPQFLRVIPRVSALEVVAEGLLLRGLDRAAALGAARECLFRLGVPEELWDAPPITFSGGEQQRVNVARAAALRPRLLLLDEPTASLDEETRERVNNLLLELKRAGVTMLLVSHDREILDRLADRVISLSNGREQPSGGGKSCLTE